MTRIAIIGAGAFGTALACVARRAGAEATLWARDAALARTIDSGGGIYPIFNEFLRIRGHGVYLPLILRNQ